jgi:hypothetical protein
MNNLTNLDSWLDKSKTYDIKHNLSVPLYVLLEEAVSVSGFLKRYWDTSDDRPGMCLAGKEITSESASEILSLAAAVQEAQTRYLAATENTNNNNKIGDRARFLLRELKQVTRWAFHGEDPDHTEARQQLDALDKSNKAKRHNRRQLIEELTAYTQLAITHSDLIKKVPTFDTSIIDEAVSIKDNLHQVRPGRPKATQAGSQALENRRRLTHLLQEYVRTVRTAARFVFRNNPNIVRQVTSNYERKRRAASRTDNSRAS